MSFPISRIPDGTRTIGVIALLACAPLALTCCETTASQPKAANRPLVVPAGGNAYLLFGAAKVEEHEGDKIVKSKDVPAGAGTPAAAGFDLASGEYSAVAYAGKLARVKLGERDVTWRDAPWNSGSSAHGGSTAPGSIAVKGTLAIALAGSDVYFHDLESGKTETHDVGRWFKEHELGTPLFAAPISDTQFVFVGADGPKPWVQVVDRASGTWTSLDKKAVSDIQRIHVCSSDGRALYLAGVREVEMRSLGGPRAGDLRQTLIVSRMDLDPKNGFVIRPIVKRERQAIESIVTQVAAGPNLVLVALDDGELMAFRIGIDASGASELVFDKRYGQRVAAVWLDEGTIAVEGLDDHRVRIETVAAGH
jgi:hypothetical protein